MKVIDILNKIANGEEVPNLIKYKNYIFNLKEEYNDYYNGEDYLFSTYIGEYAVNTFLNDEVEIIEEDKKIEKIEKIDMFDYFTGYDFDGTSKDLLKHLERNFEKTNEKFNEIIDCINKENK